MILFSPEKILLTFPIGQEMKWNEVYSCSASHHNLYCVACISIL